MTAGLIGSVVLDAYETPPALYDGEARKCADMLGHLYPDASIPPTMTIFR